MTRVAIVGSRGYPDARRAVEVYIRDRTRIDFDEYVSGAGGTVDLAVRDECRKWELAYIEFPADWRGPLGRGAGFARNQLIVDYADRVVAFWDGTSRGTKDTIDRAIRAHKNVEIIFS